MQSPYNKEVFIVDPWLNIICNSTCIRANDLVSHLIIVHYNMKPKNYLSSLSNIDISVFITKVLKCLMIVSCLQTAISALQSVLQEDFKATEIEVQIVALLISPLFILISNAIETIPDFLISVLIGVYLNKWTWNDICFNCLNCIVFRWELF